MGECDLRFKVQDLRRWILRAEDMVPIPVINHPPALTRRPSLTKEGSVSLTQGGRFRQLSLREIPMEATISMKIKVLTGNSMISEEIVSC